MWADRRRCHQRQQFGVHQQHLGAAMLQDPQQFGGLQPGVQHHHNGADPHGGEVGLERHRLHWAPGPPRGRRAERRPLEGGGAFFDPVREFGIGKPAVAVDTARLSR